MNRARPIEYTVAANGCWIVTSHSSSPGAYTVATVGGRAQRLNRWSLEQALGRPLAKGMFALHECDNPPCINPAHLYEGTSADNSRDMWKRGRVRPRVCTEKPPRVQLIELQRRKPIDQLLRELAEKHDRLEPQAAELGVSLVTLRKWRADFVDEAARTPERTTAAGASQ